MFSWIILGTIIGAYLQIRKIPFGSNFDLGRAFKFSVSTLAFLISVVGISLMIWFSLEPVSFGQYFYPIVQFLSANIVGEVLSLGLAWILKGHERSLMNFRKT